MNSIASWFLVIPSRREAVLVVSPIAVYSTPLLGADVAGQTVPAVQADPHFFEAVLEALWAASQSLNLVQARPRSSPAPP